MFFLPPLKDSGFLISLFLLFFFFLLLLHHTSTTCHHIHSRQNIRLYSTHSLHSVHSLHFYFQYIHSLSDSRNKLFSEPTLAESPHSTLKKLTVIPQTVHHTRAFITFKSSKSRCISAPSFPLPSQASSSLLPASLSTPALFQTQPKVRPVFYP